MRLTQDQGRQMMPGKDLSGRGCDSLRVSNEVGTEANKM